jgi:hypothetical protein
VANNSPCWMRPVRQHCNSSRASQVSKESRGLARMTRIGNAGILRRSKSVFIRGNRPSVSAALSCVPRVFICQRASGRKGHPGIASIVHACTCVSMGPQPIVVRAVVNHYRLWLRPKSGAGDSRVQVSSGRDKRDADATAGGRCAAKRSAPVGRQDAERLVCAFPRGSAECYPHFSNKLVVISRRTLGATLASQFSTRS